MDQRLMLIKEMVQPCGTAADIGTDHGFLVCGLVADGTAQRGIAADINPMPLEKARSEIAAQGLGERIDVLLTDGLNGVALNSGDAVVIAGMGGELIARIMEDWRKHTERGIDYYLQPMTKPEKLRDYLYQSGFDIVLERCCVAAGRPYSVMHVRYTGAVQQPSPIQRFMGEIDAEAGSAEAAYCHKLHGRLSKRLRGIAGDSKHSAEAEMLRTVIDEIARRKNHVSS